MHLTHHAKHTFFTKGLVMSEELTNELETQETELVSEIDILLEEVKGLQELVACKEQQLMEIQEVVVYGRSMGIVQ